MTDKYRKGHWMQTASGRKFWPLDPRSDEVFIEDIAHSLSMQCRYGGHCKHFYSVAEHSVHASYLVSGMHAFTALMHDAAEAYCTDIIRPIKKFLTEYGAIEQRIWEVIAEKFGLPIFLPQAVHDADIAMLFSEEKAVMSPSQEGFGMGLKTPIVTRMPIACWRPEVARKRFLDRFDDLYYRRKVA